MAALMVQFGIMIADTRLEVGIVAVGHLTPGYFRESKQTGEGQVFGIVLRTVLIQQGKFLQYGAVNELVGPEAALYPDDGGSGRVIIDFHRIAFLERDRGHPSRCLDLAGCLALGKIEVHVGSRSQNGLVSRTGSLNTVAYVVPHQCHYRILNLSPLYDFFPTDDGTAFLLHHVRNDIGQIALQFRSLCQSLAFHDLLTARTFFPAGIYGLVSSDVDVV